METPLKLPCDCENPRILHLYGCVERRIEHPEKPRTMESFRCTCGKVHNIVLTECRGCSRLHLPLPGWAGQWTFKEPGLVPM